MTTTVRKITAGTVVYNVVDSFVIRDGEGNVYLTGSSGEFGMQNGIDDNGKSYTYEVFGVGSSNYKLTIRYGTLKVTQR